MKRIKDRPEKSDDPHFRNILTHDVPRGFDQLFLILREFCGRHSVTASPRLHQRHLSTWHIGISRFITGYQTTHNKYLCSWYLQLFINITYIRDIGLVRTSSFDHSAAINFPKDFISGRRKHSVLLTTTVGRGWSWRSCDSPWSQRVSALTIWYCNYGGRAVFIVRAITEIFSNNRRKRKLLVSTDIYWLSQQM